jgi:periplasmic divalent cation tolerance protein
MTKFIEVITTFDSVGEGRKMAQKIIEKRLGGCCSIQGIESKYRWKGKIETVAECQLTIKTAENLYSKLEKFILENHSYKTPQIISLPILDGSRDYLKWLEEETKQ